MTKPAVGFIGLGNMGQPMAGNLLAAGYRLKVFNRTQGRADPLVEKGAGRAETPAGAVERAGIAITMVANDQALEEVTLGPAGIARALGANGLHISMSTVSPETSRLLAEEHGRLGAQFLAAPVFGRPEAAAARKLWICQSGAAQAKERARPILECLGQGVRDFGDEPGAANVVKLCGNYLILSAIGALSEALTLAEKNQVDRSTLAAFFGETVFSCPVYQNYGRILAKRSYKPAGFRLKLGMKDITLIRNAAEAVQAPMPIADILHANLLSALAKNRGELDWTAMELSVAEAAGLNPSEI